MNRQQRRHPGKQVKDTQRPITTQYGHNGQQVLIRWDRPIDGLLLTDEQVDNMVEMLKNAKQQLHDHKVANGTQPS
jgi:hypothetical protein